MRGRVAFGPFLLILDERRLLRDGAPVELGARAFDLLATLVTSSNAVVGKAELLARVWPDVTVEEGSLRFQIANLRKVLGEGRNGVRYIATQAGRGYRFVGPVSRIDASLGQRPAKTAEHAFPVLPCRPARVIGRSEDMATVAERLSAKRFITIVGMGGVGKTTVAMEVGHDLTDAFAGAVYSVDLGLVTDPALVPATVVSMFGLAFDPGDPIGSLVDFLGRRRSCLILDTCEHVIEAVAALTAHVFETVPDVYILTTSREPLRVKGEYVYRLLPLALPPDAADLTPGKLADYAATRLFLERVTAGGGAELDRAGAPLVVQICRQLDGVPLAIELVAGRVAGLGLQKTAELLSKSLALKWTGQRTAPARQQNLQATLAWSYRLLSEAERLVLHRLAVFVSHFPIEAALAAVTNTDVDDALVLVAIDGLVAKSMLFTRPTGTTLRYRLLDTTRTFLLQNGFERQTERALRCRHAAFYLTWLEQTGATWQLLSSTPERSCHLAALANVRVAIDWCCGPGGDAAMGERLSAAAGPVLLSMSLQPELRGIGLPHKAEGRGNPAGGKGRR